MARVARARATYPARNSTTPPTPHCSCYYGNGFNCACTSVFFSLVSTILLWWFVDPNFSSGSVYEFGAKGGSSGYADASAPLGGGSSGASFQGSFQGAAGGGDAAPASSGASASGGYSGFGSAEL